MANIVCGNGKLFTASGRELTINHIVTKLDDIEVEDRHAYDWQLPPPFTTTFTFKTTKLSKSFLRQLGIGKPRIHKYSKSARRYK